MDTNYTNFQPSPELNDPKNLNFFGTTDQRLIVISTILGYPSLEAKYLFEKFLNEGYTVFYNLPEENLTKRLQKSLDELFDILYSGIGKYEGKYEELLNILYKNVYKVLEVFNYMAEVTSEELLRCNFLMCRLEDIIKKLEMYLDVKELPSANNIAYKDDYRE